MGSMSNPDTVCFLDIARLIDEKIGGDQMVWFRLGDSLSQLLWCAYQALVRRNHFRPSIDGCVDDPVVETLVVRVSWMH